MIVAPQPEATEAGAEMLREGGNAVDAGIACALVQGVVDPMMCGIAGFGSCGIYMPAKNFHGYIDAHAPAPLAARPDMWANLIESEARDGYGFILRGRVNDIGYQSICAPANLKMYHEAHKAHGSLPWSRIVEPAIAWADDGWTVRPHVHYWWSDEGAFGRAPNWERTGFTPAARALYCRPDGTPKRVGDRVVNRDYAQTLRAIAKEGGDVFYSGEVAHAIAEDMRKNDALLSLDDLKAWKPVHNAPLWGDYRGYRVSTNQPPGGGVMLLEMLNILENFDLRGLEHNSTEYLRVVSEAMKRATIDKDAHVGDPRFVEVPVGQLTSKDYAKRLAGEIERGIKAKVPRFNSGAVSKDTTHISVLDQDGNCFSMTHSLGMPSGVVTPGLGFMYNGCMGVFDPRPGRAGSIAPGKARFSSVVPSILFKDGKPHLIIGAPGATQIAMGVLQVVLNALDFDMTMVEAVSAPRFSATSDAIDVSNRIPRRVERELQALDYPVVRSPYTFGFAAVHAIRIHHDGLDGGADPGHDGNVIAV
ncbi:MAG: gamma-glutamyltransferase [Alphaproteobacteria bacterium]|nr:gamma-glutamyltransferase [Alphaproteobacteria bacterium]MBV8412685.1 gamma-glutamyltransferase [Alphaproteobacteria bacterium]